MPTNVLLRAGNWAVGRAVRWRRNVAVARGARVNWWRLRHIAGRLEIGQDSMVSCRIDFDHPQGVVAIGSRSYIGASHLVCHSRIVIEDDVLVSWGVVISDHDSHSLDWRLRRDEVKAWREGRKSWEGVGIKPVRICRGAWIGFGAAILKGVVIGEGAVVGARAVVTRDVAPHTLVAGNPATLIRTLSPGEPEP